MTYYQVAIPDGDGERPWALLRITLGLSRDIVDIHAIGYHSSYGIASYWVHQLMTRQRTEDEVARALETGVVG